MNNYRTKLYSNYNSTIYGVEGKNLPDLKMAHENMEREYSRFLPKNTNAAILDVGCGMGHFLSYLKHHGFTNAVGVDHSPEQVACCLSAGLPVSKIDDIFIFLNSQKNAYDFILLSDVLEHFYKDEVMQVLEGLRGALREGGTLVLRVPNMSGVNGLNGRYIDFTHEVGFTESSLKQVLMCSGFKNIRIEDNKVPFGWRPKRFVRWVMFAIWRKILNIIFLLEVGEDKPRLLGKNLIAAATR